jgi:hypothetical protein
VEEKKKWGKVPEGMWKRGEPLPGDEPEDGRWRG